MHPITLVTTDGSSVQFTNSVLGPRGWRGQSSVDHELVGSHISENLAGLLVEQVKIEVRLREAVGLVPHALHFQLEQVEFALKLDFGLLNLESADDAVVACTAE